MKSSGPRAPQASRNLTPNGRSPVLVAEVFMCFSLCSKIRDHFVKIVILMLEKTILERRGKIKGESS
jgi:hypothetical protein